jgi:hypothetical protein
MGYEIFLCATCNQPEDKCECVKYCQLCHSDYDVRLTQDGLYYCRDCREACDYKSQDNT